LADFETYSHLLKVGGGQADASKGDYVRSALQRGLQIDDEVGANPYKVGMIGSTDSHTGLASAEESNFWGKFAIDSTPETTFVDIAASIRGADMSASGLAAVWAEENTRTSLFAAFKRKEVYATTGPRIRVRFFGGWHFKSKNATQANMVNIGYAYGHPMGSDLTKAPEDEAPKFLMYAVRDPAGANLDRMQGSMTSRWRGPDSTTSKAGRYRSPARWTSRRGRTATYLGRPPSRHTGKIRSSIVRSELFTISGCFRSQRPGTRSPMRLRSAWTRTTRGIPR
ncbi:MAG: DUF3604 domain-containing protein, partial [Deltaproteobacteria bacterium]|nr:DUF3604 domain-containing protein [Deltaproteobacteria bacterium]